MVVWAGDGGPGKLNRQPSLFSCSILAGREVSVSPLERMNRTRRVYMIRRNSTTGTNDFPP